MSISTQLAAINNHFTLNFSSTAIAYQNINFDTKSVKEYVKITPIFGDAEQITQGATSNRYRQKGVLSIQIFTEVGVGGKRAADLADEIMSIWRGLNIAGLIFTSPDTVIVGNTEDGFYQTNILTDFYFDFFS